MHYFGIDIVNAHIIKYKDFDMVLKIRLKQRAEGSDKTRFKLEDGRGTVFYADFIDRGYNIESLVKIRSVRKM